MYARVNCSIVKCANAGLKNSAIVSLARRRSFASLASRTLRSAPSENISVVSFHGLRARIQSEVCLSFLSDIYAFRQARHRATVYTALPDINVKQELRRGHIIVHFHAFSRCFHTLFPPPIFFLEKQKSASFNHSCKYQKLTIY